MYVATTYEFVLTDNLLVFTSEFEDEVGAGVTLLATIIALLSIDPCFDSCAYCD